MSEKIYDLAVNLGSYQDRNGNKRANWLNIGGVFKGDDGKSYITLRRSFNPAGVPFNGSNNEDVIFISLFPPKISNK